MHYISGFSNGISTNDVVWFDFSLKLKLMPTYIQEDCN